VLLLLRVKVAVRGFLYFPCQSRGPRGKFRRPQNKTLKQALHSISQWKKNIERTQKKVEGVFCLSFFPGCGTEKVVSSILIAFFHHHLGSMTALPDGVPMLNEGIRGWDLFENTAYPEMK